MEDAQQRYTAMFNDIAQRQEFISVDDTRRQLCEEGLSYTAEEVRTLMKLANMRDDISIDDFSRLFYVCENAHKTDLASILFFLNDKSYNREITFEQFEQVLNLLKIKQENLPALEAKINKNYLDFTTYSIIMQQILQ